VFCGYVPSVNNSFQLISYPSFSGSFTKTNLPPQAIWQTTYNPGNVTVTAQLINQVVPALYTETVSSVNTQIPAGDPVGVVFTNRISDISAGWIVSRLTVTLNLSGGYNGGLYAELIAPNGTVVPLMDQPGVQVNGVGAYGAGLQVTFADGAAKPIQLETNGGVLTGSYSPDGTLASINGSPAAGTWTLFIADLESGGGNSTLNSWSLGLTASPQPVTVNLARHTGTSASSTYGDAVSFDAAVSGVDSGLPTGTVVLYDGGLSGTPFSTNTLSGGVCTLTPPLNALSAGVHNDIIAYYSGDATFAGGTSAALSAAQTIADKNLTLSGVTALNKTYDATPSASLDASGASLVGVVNGDANNVALVSSGATATFASANAGAETVNTTGFALSGSAAPNYTLAQPTLSATIAPKGLTVAGTLSVPSSKVYDGTATATIQGAPALLGAEAPGTGSTSDGAPYSADAVSLSGTVSAAYNSPSVLSATTISYNSGALSLTGSGYGNYSLIALPSVSATIAPLPVVLSGSRLYDGTATALAGILNVANKISGDDVTIAAGSGTLAAASAGVEPITSFGSLAPGGTTAPNYTFSGGSGSVTITKAALSITANAQSKTYGTALNLGTSAFTTSPLQNGETVESVTLTASGGTAATAPVSGSPYLITPGAATGTFNTANYTITYNTGTLAVNPLAVILTGTREYDGTTNAAYGILSVSNIVGSDSITVASGSGGLASADIGANALTSLGTLALGGTAVNNYTLSGAGGAVIVTPLPVVLTGERSYDGTATAPASILTINNDVDGANLTLTGSATLAGANAVLQSITDFTGLTLGGTAATNYTLTGASGSVTVTKAALSITANAQSKTYGTALSLGTTAFSVGSGLVESEAVTAVTLTASGGTATTDAVSGLPYTITPSAATGTGGFLAANYNITYNTGTLTVNPLAVVLTGTRTYDGTATAAYGILTVVNKVGSDDVSAASGAATLAGPNVGPEAITAAGSLELGGLTAGNYTLIGVSGSVVIGQAQSSLALSSSENPSGYLDSIFFTATVPATASGSVIFSTNGVALSTNAISGGAAQCAATALLPRGADTITAAYAGDVNYIGATNNLTQTVTNHPPVAAPLTVTRTAGLELLIPFASLQANWSDVDGDTITLASLGPVSTNGVTLRTNLAYIIYTNGPNVNDQLSYTISDGHGGTATGVVHITITSTVWGQLQSLAVVNRGVTVNGVGVPGYTYQVQRTTDMVTWTTLASVTAPASSLFSVTDDFSDLGSPPASAWYRIEWNP